MRILLSVLAVLMLHGCSTTSSPIIGESDDGQVMLGYSHIGEGYDNVVTRAVGKYAAQPQCESRKISLQKQRKAFLYEVCGFTPENRLFSNEQPSEVVYHFIGDVLVRVDVRAEGESALLNSVKEDMASIFGSNQSTLGKDSYQWAANERVAGVRAGTGGSAGNVHIRLLDETLADNAPWLAVE